jgi:hypothetical protein
MLLDVVLSGFTPFLFLGLSSLCLACIAYSSFVREVGVEPKIIRQQKSLPFQLE